MELILTIQIDDEDPSTNEITNALEFTLTTILEHKKNILDWSFRDQ